MTRTLQILRGTNAQNIAFTGAAGELTMDTTNNQLRLHDGSTAGGHIIGAYHPDLFDHKWSDHIVNDMQWLRADTFSWQSGSTYANAYNHLVADIDGKSLTSETIAGITVQFYLADDGHKICPASEESNVAAIYTATGVAWYYVLDITNTRFKLPRTKFGMTGLRDAVGNYVAPGLPNITGSFEAKSNTGNATGAFSSTALSTNRGYQGDWYNYLFDFDASDANPIYGNSTTVQPPATQMYLYFYVGEFTQTALENTAGLNASLFNAKADIGHEVIAFQEPTSSNGYTWYRKYRDGWVEQGGTIVGNATVATITLPVTMANTNYQVTTTQITSSTDNLTRRADGITTKNTTSFTSYTPNNDSKDWVVYGKAAA